MPIVLASPHAACSCSSVIVCLPPSRMLADAKIFTTSAPSVLSWRTFSRISAGVPLRSFSCRIEVRMRGPGMTPRAIASRRSTSLAEPGL
jgi:hypothetical protein